MYCYHCAFDIDIAKAETQANRFGLKRSIAAIDEAIVCAKNDNLKNITDLKKKYEPDLKMAKEAALKEKEAAKKEQRSVNEGIIEKVSSIEKELNEEIAKIDSECKKKIKELEESKNNCRYVPEIEGTDIVYVCPRCGHLIHEGYDEKDLKSLSMASHSELQRSRNDFALGMSFVSIGVILLIIGIIFFVLAKKPANHYELVTTCSEFYVSVVLSSLAIILLGAGGYFAVKGFTKNRKYTSLLKDLNNSNFVQ